MKTVEDEEKEFAHLCTISTFDPLFHWYYRHNKMHCLNKQWNPALPGYREGKLKDIVT